MHLITGASLPQNKDPGRLLLLCVRASRTSAGSCPLLRWNGAQHDQNYQVMLLFFTPSSCFVVSDSVVSFFSVNAITRQVIPVVAQRPQNYLCRRNWIFLIHGMHGNADKMCSINLCCFRLRDIIALCAMQVIGFTVLNSPDLVSLPFLRGEGDLNYLL